MRVECPTCGKKYNFPDDRINSLKKLAFRCPACKGVIKIELRSTENEESIPKPGGDQQTDPSKDLMAEITKAIEDLEPMPEVILKAREEMSKPDATFKEIGKVLETDQAIVAKVHRIANSAYYGLNGRVSRIHQALVVLGHKTLEQVINTAWASKILANPMQGYGFEAGTLWNHSLAVAMGAKEIAVKRQPTLENDAFTAGLLHDVGKLILDEHILKNKSAFDSLKKDNTSCRKVEETIFGFDHSKISALICKQWHLPEIQASAIKFHHTPESAPDNELAYVLYMADYLARKCGFGTEPMDDAETVKDNILEYLELKKEDLDPIMHVISEYVTNISKSVL